MPTHTSADHHTAPPPPPTPMRKQRQNPTPSPARRALRKWAARPPTPPSPSLPPSSLTSSLPPLSTQTGFSLSTSPSLDRDGPRSLPSKRYSRGVAMADGPSYSSLARVGGEDKVVASLSMPAVAEQENRTAAARSKRHHSLLRNGDGGLTRSDSLLNKARRVFSLPPSLKRGKSGLVEERPERVERPEDVVRSNTEGRGTLAYRRGERMRRMGSRRESGMGPRRESGMKDRREEEEVEIRVRQLEDELEASRVREARLRKRVQHLEEERGVDKAAMPALESIVKVALRHFEAKEAALKHTIAKMDQDYAVVVSEKNEAVRLLTAFVGRGGRSPPASFSSVSEAGTEGIFVKDGRRALSVDTFRRGSPTHRGFNEE